MTKHEDSMKRIQDDMKRIDEDGMKRIDVKKKPDEGMKISIVVSLKRLDDARKTFSGLRPLYRRSRRASRRPHLREAPTPPVGPSILLLRDRRLRRWPLYSHRN